MPKLVSAIRSNAGVRRASGRAARLIRRERTRLLANGLNTLAMSSIAAAVTAPFVAAFLGIPCGPLRDGRVSAIMVQFLGFVAVPVVRVACGWGAAIVHVRGLQRGKGDGI